MDLHKADFLKNSLNWNISVLQVNNNHQFVQTISTPICKENSNVTFELQILSWQLRMNRLFNPLHCTLYAIIYLHLSILRHIARYPFEQSKTNSLFLSMPGSYTIGTIGISYLSVTDKKSILILFACSFTGLKLSSGNCRKCIIITVCIITFFLMIIFIRYVQSRYK